MSEDSILLQSANKCVKCAKCVPTCSIYSVNRDETTSPRGYLDLVSAYANGALPLDASLKDSIESCFLCATCVTQCPMNLPIDFVIQRARADIAKEYGIPLYKRILFYLLGRRKILNIIFSLGYYFNPCLFKEKNGYKKLRFSFKKLGDRAISPLNARSFLQTYKGLIKSSANAEKRRVVGIYIGCLSNYNYKNVGVSLLKILDALGIDALIPHKQECCGAPAFFSGDVRNTTILIKKNLDYLLPYLEKIEALLIPEATCAAMLLSDWNHALDIESEVFGIDNKEYLEKIELLKQKTFMASKWLHDNTNLEQILSDHNMDISVTYHDPCHAKKVLKIHNEPRRLLKPFKLTEMKDSDVCCGFGGVTIQSEKYHLAKSVGDRKVKNIAATNASIVSAECSACRMQIDDSMYRNNINAKFMHPLELIAKSLEDINELKQRAI